MKVFVHLARGFGSAAWRERCRRGHVLGLNEEAAYGYNHAASDEVLITYATDYPENCLQKLARYAGRFILGFDVVHAWRNRHELLDADVVWTHTESQTLGVLLLFRLVEAFHLSRRRLPKLIGQTVWLLDRWSSQPLWRRWLFRSLLRRLDVLTVHSQLNCADARALFPWLRVERIHFGIRAEGMYPARAPHSADSIAVLSLGNDEHRDWGTLCRAADELPSAAFRIVSRASAARRAAKGHRNVTLMRVKNNRELFATYEQADVVVVPLKLNRHVSGITVILEATYFGVPVIATACGGLEDYLDPSAVLYVPLGRPTALADAIRAIKADPEAARKRVEKAQHRMRTTLNSMAYAEAHVALSRELLGE
ncbi:glycosyltransferase [Acetobacter conturbans]|uniref:Glycosyltransferase n=1 Tax=Acetobacter conturbans TaxID=1737472 RepID=A0ABX0K1C5_9PROT|nr:glycosyltransferase [Acetobacter conturbans]